MTVEELFAQYGTQTAIAQLNIVTGRVRLTPVKYRGDRMAQPGDTVVAKVTPKP